MRIGSLALVAALTAGCACDAVLDAATPVAYVLVTPQVLTADHDGEGQVLIEASMISAWQRPDRLGVDPVVQAGDVELEMIQSEGVRVVATPSVVARFGERADVFVGTERMVGGTSHAESGYSFGVVPRAVSGGLELELVFEQRHDDHSVRSAGPIRFVVPTGKSVLLETHAREKRSARTTGTALGP